MTFSPPLAAADGSLSASGAAAHRPWLAENRLFRGIPAETLEELIELPELVALEPGTVLFDEGADGDCCLYLVASGAVLLTRRGAAGTGAETLAHFGDGDFFGEAALLDLASHAARAVVTRPSVLGRVDRGAFERMLRMAPGRISTNLTHGLMERMRGASDPGTAELIRAERVSLIGSMAAMVAHDFKNPMSAILMAADLIAETSDSPDHAESAAVIRRAVSQMVDLTEELLDFARGTPCSRPEPVAVVGLMADLETGALRRMKRDGIRVVPDLRWQGELRAERRRLGRALANVARFAAESMPDGGDLRITVEARGDRVAITFADTGEGISADALSTLFEPFISNGKPGGSGLGMALARSIAEAHGGSVSATSVPGQGTTVEFVLPIAGPPPLGGV